MISYSVDYNYKPIAKISERQMTKANEKLNLGAARSDNSTTATEVYICELNESGDKWFSKTDSNCELIRVDLTTQLKECKNWKYHSNEMHRHALVHFCECTHTYTHALTRTGIQN